MKIELITPEQYAIERAICDKAEAYAEAIMTEGGTKRRRNYLTAEEAAHPDYAACNNDMRGRVEQYELLRDRPDKFTAYISSCETMATVWTGLPLGRATVTASWKPGRSRDVMKQFVVWMGGNRYIGRGFGSGMYINLRKANKT